MAMWRLDTGRSGHEVGEQARLHVLDLVCRAAVAVCFLAD